MYLCSQNEGKGVGLGTTNTQTTHSRTINNQTVTGVVRTKTVVPNPFVVQPDC